MSTTEGPPPIRRVLILAADVGAGHLVPARALAAELGARGVEVVVEEDLRTSLGLVKRLAIREGSRVLLARAPWAYDLYYRLLLRVAPVRAMTARSLRRSGGRRILRLIRRHRPDVVVSTYPGTTVVLGELRRRRRLDVPVAAVITDLAGLFFWAHRGVDEHLLAWAESRPEVERVSRASNATHVVAPTDAQFFRPDDRAAARGRLGLAAAERVVVVSGGGWGVGDLGDSVAAAIRADADRVIVLAGRNERLRSALAARFGADVRVRVLGFTDRMSDLLGAADVLVHATVGVTCLEAALRGCPTVVHGLSVGHIRHNAQHMAQHGLVQRAADEGELTAVLRRILADPAGARPAMPSRDLPTAADVISRAAPRIAPIPRWRLAWQRLSPATAAIAVGAALSSPGAYALAAHSGDDVRAAQRVPVRRPEVAVVVRAGAAPTAALVRALGAAGLHVSVALTAAAPPAVVAAAHGAGIDLVPALGPDRGLGWIGTVDRIRDIRGREDGGGGAYVVPVRGYTLGQYVLGRAAKAWPVAPQRLRAGQARPGDILEARGGDDARRLSAGLARRGLVAVTLAQLVRDRAG